MLHRLTLWFNSSRQQKQLYREACWQLLRARYRLLRYPFKRIASTLGKLDQCGEQRALTELELLAARDVTRSIKIMAKYVPWQSKCLVQAMAAQRMLTKRYVESTLYLGVNKNGSDMKAHAWLRSGPYYITGGNGEREYTVVRSFYKSAKALNDNELQALLWLCEAKDGDYCHRHLANLVTSEDFDWSHLVHLSQRHGVTPLVNRNSQLLIKSLIPSDIKLRLHQLTSKLTQRSLSLTAECIKLQRICDAENIPISFMKGPALAIQLYGNPALRSYSDIDCFCDKKNIIKLTDLLTQKHNYTHKNSFNSAQLSYHLKHHKDMPMRSPNSQALIEIHWRYTYESQLLKRLRENNIDYTTRQTFQNGSITALNHAAHCCYLAYHGAKHGWSTMKWLSDFYHMSKHVETNQLIRLSQTLNVKHFVVHALLVTHTLFECQARSLPQPSKHDAILLNTALCLIDETSCNNVLKQRILKYRLIAGLAQDWPTKINLLTKMLKSSHDEWQVISLHRSLFFLYTLMRPLNWMSKHLKRGS